MAKDDQNKNDNSENKDRAKAAVEFALTGMLQNMSMKMCDDFVDKNASVASKAGLVAILIRETHGTPCEFCAELAGRYDYENRPSGIRSRHKGCQCTIDFKTERKPGGSIIIGNTDKEARIKRIQASNEAVASGPKLLMPPAKLDFVESIESNPRILGTFSPITLKRELENRGFEVTPLSKGHHKGVDFEHGGGYKVNYRGDGILQYHPAKQSRHGGRYYKIGNAEKGIKWYNMRGEEIDIGAIGKSGHQIIKKI